MKNNTLKKTALAALFAAITFICTYFAIPLSANGYANLGDCFVIISGIILGPYGIAAAALGSALCDIVLGFAYYAPATFIIKGIMATVAFLICGFKSNKSNLFRIIFTAIICEIIMVFGYFLFEAIVYGTATAIADIIGNSMQALVGVFSATVVYSILHKTKIVDMIKRL